MKLTTEVQPGGMVMVRLWGRLDQITSPVVRQRLSLLIQMGYVCLVINLKGVSSLDHDGALALFDEWKRSQLVGGYLYLSQVSDYAQHIFDEVQINMTPYNHPLFGIVLCFVGTTDEPKKGSAHVSADGCSMSMQELTTAA